MDDRKSAERKRRQDDEPDDLGTGAPASPPRAGRPVHGVGPAVTGPHGVGAPDVTEDELPEKDERE